MSARLVLVGLAIGLALAAPPLRAQESDHPTEKTLVVGSDIGIAPSMVRGTGGPEGFGVDMVNEIAKRLGRPGVEIVDVNFSGAYLRPGRWPGDGCRHVVRRAPALFPRASMARSGGGGGRQHPLSAPARPGAARECRRDRRHRLRAAIRFVGCRGRLPGVARNPGMKRLAGKVAIVTGGASGIGRAITRLFAQEGATVVIADVTGTVREGGTPTHELLRAEGFPVEFVKTDVSAEWEAEAVVRHTSERHGCLDILVNDAAIGLGKPLLATSREEWERVLAVNLTGVFLMCRAAVRQMLRQEPRNETRGRIVNISSQHGMIAAPEDIAYGTSKSGVVYITRQIAADYAKDQIICNAVAPGKILTGKAGRAVEPRWIEYSRSRTPMARLGTPEDVARAALFLASDEATYLTGVNLMVDGGWMAVGPLDSGPEVA